MEFPSKQTKEISYYEVLGIEKKAEKTEIKVRK
jgi:DnaJ-class molecular chaperone